MSGKKSMEKALVRFGAVIESATESMYAAF
jgi:hypothetical protein